MEIDFFTIAFVIFIGWLFIRQIHALAHYGFYKRIPVTTAMFSTFILVQNYVPEAAYQVLVSIYTFIVYIENAKLLLSDQTD
jgi:hypothetical protein